MPHKQKDVSVKDIFSMVAPYIDPLDSVFSFGLCHLWRRRLVADIQAGEHVLDICTGTGEVARLLLKRVGSGGSLTGADFCPDMLEIARGKMTPLPRNVSLVICDAQALTFPDSTFDAVTVAFGMRNIPDTVAALGEIRRVLKPGGRFFCLELTKPRKRWFLPFYLWYTSKVMPSIARIVVKTDVPYTYLPKSIDAFYPPDEFTGIMEKCGFSDIAAQSMSIGMATIYHGVKK